MNPLPHDGLVRGDISRRRDGRLAENRPRTLQVVSDLVKLLLQQGSLHVWERTHGVGRVRLTFAGPDPSARLGLSR